MSSLQHDPIPCGGGKSPYGCFRAITSYQKNNTYFLMMVDQFTKWVECIPLPTQSAEVTARAAINEFFSKFGYPLQIFTDQGTNFTIQLFSNICEALEIHKTRTTP